MSTAGFVPPPVYIGIPLFVLPRRCSRQLNSMPWEARRTVDSWAARPVGVLLYPAPLRPAAPPHAAPSRPARGMFGFWIRYVQFPDTPYMKRVHREKSVARLVSSQEQRALLAPIINRLLIAYQTIVNRLLCFPIVLHIISLDRVSGSSDVQETCLCFRCLRAYESRAFHGRKFVCRRPVLRGAASPICCAPRPGSPVICLGFGRDIYLFI